jgi:chemotaxis protein MotB
MARRRRRGHEEPSNHERWLVSYADFITLLFAFFVVMYAISSVNEGKYRVLSESLNAVFNEQARSLEPIQVGEPVRDPLALPEQQTGPISRGVDGTAEAEPVPEPVPDATGDDAGPGGGLGGRFRADEPAEDIAREVGISLARYVEEGLVRIHRNGGRVEIEMKDRMLFPSGTARLSNEAIPALRALARSMERIPSHVQVEGHTDDVPISTAAFPSNWELSAARAASVVDYLSRTGIEPWRLAAVGMGQHRPIAENDSPQGRAANRRVKIVVLTGERPASSESLDFDVPWAEGPALERR